MSSTLTTPCDAEHLGREETGQDQEQQARHGEEIVADASIPEVGSKEGEGPSSDDSNKSPRKMKFYVWIIVVISVLSSTFLFALDNTIVADVQPRIIEDLGEIQKLPWISVAFSVGAVSTNLLWGKLFALFDVKTLFLIAVVTFEAGSAICGSAPTMDALVVGRAICGVGGVGIYLGAINVLSVFTTIAERPTYISLIALTWGLGTVLGPIIGGAFTDSQATWRWSFYINLCVGAVAGPAYIFLLPSTQPQPTLSRRSKLFSFDYVGAILFIGASLSGTMAISFGGSLYDWSSGQTIGLFCCSGVLWILFGLQQSFRVITDPDKQLFPVYLVKSWSMSVLFAQTAASITATFIPIYFIPLFFQFTRGNTALEAGVRLLPFVFLDVASVIANGVIMGKTGLYMPWFLFGGVLTVIGAALLYTTDLNTSVAKIYGYSIVLAVGTGSFSQASFPIAQAKSEPHQIPDAVAFISCAQLGGMTLALSISNSVFINRATRGIGMVLPDAPQQTVQAAIGGAGNAFFQTLPESKRNDVLRATVTAINDTYVLVLASGATSVALALFMKRERLFIGGGE